MTWNPIALRRWIRNLQSNLAWSKKRIEIADRTVECALKAWDDERHTRMKFENALDTVRADRNVMIDENRALRSRVDALDEESEDLTAEVEELQKKLNDTEAALDLAVGELDDLSKKGIAEANGFRPPEPVTVEFSLRFPVDANGAEVES